MRHLFWVTRLFFYYFCDIFVRKKKNRSGSTSVIVVEKNSNKYKEHISIRRWFSLRENRQFHEGNLIDIAFLHFPVGKNVSTKMHIAIKRLLRRYGYQTSGTHLSRTHKSNEITLNS